MHKSEAGETDATRETDPDQASTSRTDNRVDQDPSDIAERPGTSGAEHRHADELADEWGHESFPSSDPPAHY